jgi:hypothetical protein
MRASPEIEFFLAATVICPTAKTISQSVKSVVKKFLFFFLPFNLLPE